MSKDVLGTGHLHHYGTNELKLFVFDIDGAPYAINLAKLRETLRLREEDIVPLSIRPSPYIMGQLKLRDEVISLLDLPGFLRGKPQEMVKDGVALVAEYNGHKIAIVVSDIHFNVNVEWADVMSPGEVARLGAPITGFYLNKELGIVQILDFESVRNDVIGSPYESFEATQLDLSPEPIVLFAEDSFPVRSTIEKFLNESGLRVITCTNGAEAWEIYQREHSKIDLLVSDIEMPQLDGTALVANIRHHNDGERLPIVLLSSMTNETNVAQYKQLGIDAFVGKHQMEKLVGNIVELLDEGRPLLRERAAEELKRAEAVG
ncbi:MAG: response regulator [Deltaproteobacteria bacterium]|nr:response regulator [Deltaproteobacteria bacterium]